MYEEVSVSRKLFKLEKRQEVAFSKLMEAVDECMESGIMIVNRGGTIYAFNTEVVDDFNLSNGNHAILDRSLVDVPHFHRADMQERIEKGPYYIHLTDKGWKAMWKEIR